ncbi:hypothetical protein DIPPA_16006 [Diplonema papillatum]|nr:hypothetical protein DIPPA_16006 [Diplonema papillatum]
MVETVVTTDNGHSPTPGQTPLLFEMKSPESQAGTRRNLEGASAALAPPRLSDDDTDTEEELAPPSASPPASPQNGSGAASPLGTLRSTQGRWGKTIPTLSLLRIVKEAAFLRSPSILFVEKNDANRICACFSGNRVSRVDDGGPAALAGLQRGMVISKLGDIELPGFISSPEVVRIIEELPKRFEIHIDRNNAHRDDEISTVGSASFVEFNNIEAADPMMMLTHKQAALMAVFLIFVASPALVLFISVIVAGPLAALLGWSFGRGFWLACSMLISPLGGAPQLVPDTWDTRGTNMGGRIAIMFLAVWSVGLFGILQLLMGPAIFPLFSWTRGMIIGNGETDGTTNKDQTRVASAWRLKATGETAEAPPNTVTHKAMMQAWSMWNRRKSRFARGAATVATPRRSDSHAEATTPRTARGPNTARTPRVVVRNSPSFSIKGSSAKGGGSTTTGSPMNRIMEHEESNDDGFDCTVSGL